MPFNLKASSTTSTFSTRFLCINSKIVSRLAPSFTVTKSSFFVINCETVLLKSFTKRVSRPVMIPIKLFSSSTTGYPAKPFFFTISASAARVKSGETVTGSDTIPLSNFFTLRTRSAWRSIVIFL